MQRVLRETARVRKFPRGRGIRDQDSVDVRRPSVEQRHPRVRQAVHARGRGRELRTTVLHGVVVRGVGHERPTHRVQTHVQPRVHGHAEKVVRVQENAHAPAERPDGHRASRRLRVPARREGLEYERHVTLTLILIVTTLTLTLTLILTLTLTLTRQVAELRPDQAWVRRRVPLLARGVLPRPGSQGLAAGVEPGPRRPAAARPTHQRRHDGTSASTLPLREYRREHHSTASCGADD